MSKRSVLVLMTMLVASVGINVVLGHRLRAFNRPLNGTSERLLRPGATVPPLRAVDLHGQTVTVGYSADSRPTVLYVFTPPCGWCSRNMDNFKTLVDRESDRYRFVGVSLSGEGLVQYVAKNNLSLPVYSGLSLETLKIYKLGSTPQTIVISHDGRVVQNWVGAYVGDQKKEIETYFHVNLPGLRELPKAEAAKN